MDNKGFPDFDDENISQIVQTESQKAVLEKLKDLKTLQKCENVKEIFQIKIQNLYLKNENINIKSTNNELISELKKEKEKNEIQEKEKELLKEKIIINEKQFKLQEKEFIVYKEQAETVTNASLQLFEQKFNFR